MLRITLLLAAASLALAQTTTLYETRPAQVMSNGQLSITLLDQGGTLASVTIPSNPAAPNPMWNSPRLNREMGRDVTAGGGLGHFVCVDGFGQPSAAERTAGLPGHGEAHNMKMAIRRDDAAGWVEMKTPLPLTQENFTRTWHMVPGESVVYVDSTLESLVGFDRPISWAEHATVSAPFVEPGKTVIEISGSQSRNRPYVVNTQAKGAAPSRTDRRLVSGADFTWPLTPGLDGSKVDMRTFPDTPHFIDHTATLMDTSRDTEYAVAFNSARHLIYGYLFRREDYPWIQNWGSYPSVPELTRGMEFGTQPYDVPRRDMVTMSTMFGTPTYKWLPAKSTIESHFLFFYAATPERMAKIDDVRLEGGTLVIEDKANGQQLKLAASRGLRGGK